MSLTSIQEDQAAAPPGAATTGSPAGGGSDTSFLKRQSFEEFSVYESMANTIKFAITRFLAPFQTTEESTYVAKTLLLDEFLQKFAGMANTFCDNCCQEMVKIIHASSRIEAVRITPTPDLARRVREAAFPHLDAILGHFANAARKAEILQKSIKKQRDANSRGAASLGVEDSSGPVEPVTRDDLDRFSLGLSRVRFQAYGKVAAFIQALPNLAKPLMDYASDKCFAADVIFELETEQIARIQNETREAIENALVTLGQVQVTAKGDLDRSTAQVTMTRQDDHFHAALEQLVEHRIEEKAASEARFKKAVIVVVVIAVLIVLGLAAMALQQL